VGQNRRGRGRTAQPDRPAFLRRLAGRENRFGGALIYNLADMAVLRLVELKGERALFDYFRRLRDRDAPQAFQEAFGQDLGPLRAATSSVLRTNARRPPTPIGSFPTISSPGCAGI
jgi:hypothetical protein